MDPLMTEDQELERLKEWWKRNGVAAVAGVVIGAVLVFGNNWWRAHVTQRAESASAYYEEMMVRHSEGKVEDARKLGARLMTEFDATPYAAQAALFLARLSYEAGDPESALNQLRWAREHGENEAVRHVARLREARILEDRDEREAALELLDNKDPGPYAAQYNELRGDLQAGLGRVEEARRSYDAALAALPPGIGDAERIIRMKRDDLGEQ